MGRGGTALRAHRAKGGRAGQPAGASPAERDPYDLRVYLTRAFLLVALCVVVGELAVMWLEGAFLAPTLAGYVGSLASDLTSASPLELAALLPRALLALAQSALVPGTAVGTTAVALLLAALMVALALLPLLAGALAFGLVVNRRVGEAQRRRDEERRETERQRNLVVADMAHDLRTPVTSIVGLSQALADGMVGDPADQRRALEAIGSKAREVSDLAGLLLDYTQLDSQGFDLHPARLDLAQLLLQVAAAAYTDAEAAGMVLEARVGEEPCWVVADGRQLGRVFANLVANAIRHNRPGTTVCVSLTRRTGLAVASVADDGAEISTPPDELFRPFSRGDAARGEGGGHGLGLSIAKRVCDMHGFGIALVQPYGMWTKAFVVTCPTE